MSNSLKRLLNPIEEDEYSHNNIVIGNTNLMEDLVFNDGNLSTSWDDDYNGQFPRTSQHLGPSATNYYRYENHQSRLGRG